MIISFGNLHLDPKAGTIRQGFGKKNDHPVVGAHAVADSTSTLHASSRITATRVVTGGLLLGPLGAVVGGAARKQKIATRTQNSVTVTLANGQVLYTPGLTERGAHKFAAKVNTAASQTVP
jgi:hypothetical protein